MKWLIFVVGNSKSVFCIVTVKTWKLDSKRDDTECPRDFTRSFEFVELDELGSSSSGLLWDRKLCQTNVCCSFFRWKQSMIGIWSILTNFIFTSFPILSVKLECSYSCQFDQCVLHALFCTNVVSEAFF